MNHMPALLVPGMTVTNEPGIYKAGRHGVRTEKTMLIAVSYKHLFSSAAAAPAAGPAATATDAAAGSIPYSCILYTS